MNHAGPFDRRYWIDDDPNCLKYDHEPKIVPLFRNRADAVLQAHTSHIVVEADREEGRRLWAAYLTAIRKSVDAQSDVTNAHNAWMSYQEQARG